jgi:NAD(P)-dependent dehydrogenase (short-subunit alcohol dehydrogenase family)
MPLDLVVNNAAVCEQGSSARTFARAFRVNVAAPLATCGVVLPQMRRRGFGRVINVSSGDGERVYLHSSVCDLLDGCITTRDVCAKAAATVRRFDQAVEYAHGPTPAYAWSKALLNRATQLAAVELGEGTGVLINAACPGDVCTRMMSDGVDPACARSAAHGAASLLLAAFLDEDSAESPARVHHGEFLRDGEPIAF